MSEIQDLWEMVKRMGRPFQQAAEVTDPVKAYIADNPGNGNPNKVTPWTPLRGGFGTLFGPRMPKTSAATPGGGFVNAQGVYIGPDGNPQRSVLPDAGGAGPTPGSVPY